MNYLDQKYAGETDDTKGHILVYAFNVHIYCKFFDKERAEEAYTSRTKIADHIRAGNIVKEEGYENIIRDFVKHVEEKKHSNL